jgi:hypothetical protein
MPNFVSKIGYFMHYFNGNVDLYPLLLRNIYPFYKRGLFFHFREKFIEISDCIYCVWIALDRSLIMSIKNPAPANRNGIYEEKVISVYFTSIIFLTSVNPGVSIL